MATKKDTELYCQQELNRQKETAKLNIKNKIFVTLLVVLEIESKGVVYAKHISCHIFWSEK